jgi:hypothetical protein
MWPAVEYVVDTYKTRGSIGVGKDVTNCAV